MTTYTPSDSQILAQINTIVDLCNEHKFTVLSSNRDELGRLRLDVQFVTKGKATILVDTRGTARLIKGESA